MHAPVVGPDGRRRTQIITVSRVGTNGAIASSSLGHNPHDIPCGIDSNGYVAYKLKSVIEAEGGSVKRILEAFIQEAEKIPEGRRNDVIRTAYQRANILLAAINVEATVRAAAASSALATTRTTKTDGDAEAIEDVSTQEFEVSSRQDDESSGEVFAKISSLTREREDVETGLITLSTLIKKRLSEHEQRIEENGGNMRPGAGSYIFQCVWYEQWIAAGFCVLEDLFTKMQNGSLTRKYDDIPCDLIKKSIQSASLIIAS